MDKAEIKQFVIDSIGRNNRVIEKNPGDSELIARLISQQAAFGAVLALLNR